MTIYLDTPIIIYLVEEKDDFFDKAVSRLDDPVLTINTSEIARLECRVKPLREHNQAVLSLYDQFFASHITKVVGLSRDVIDMATQLRALSGFKTPDALHLAAAIISGCDVFLTNDDRLKACTQIIIETLGGE